MAKGKGKGGPRIVRSPHNAKGPLSSSIAGQMVISPKTKVK